MEPVSPVSQVDVAHNVLRALSKVGDAPEQSKALLKRIRHVEYGLSAEAECMAILAWLGKCVFVHELNQDAYTKDGLEEMQVPDLFAVFSRDGRELRVLLEVKSTKKLFVPWTAQYSEKLARYGELLGLPILLAWRPRRLGNWLLVDPMSADLCKDGRIGLGDAMMHNLMGVIAGDFWVTPKPGIGLHLAGKILGKKVQTANGYQGTMKITDVFFGTRDNRFSEPSNAIAALVFSAASEEYCMEQGGKVLWGYITPDELGIRSSAQQLLRTLVGWARKDDQRIAWRHVLKGLNQLIPRDKMLRELTEEIGRGVTYILHLMPKTTPEFIPREWTSSKSEL